MRVHKTLIASANYIPFIAKLAPRGPAVARDGVKACNGSRNELKVGGGLAPQYGTPYVGKINPWLNRSRCRAIHRHGAR